MQPDYLVGPSVEDNASDIEEVLVRFDAYIVMLVQKRASSGSNIARPEVLDLEIDEIVQRVRIKFWRALLTKEIEHHEAYIRSIVSNEFNDLGRRRKVSLPLPTDEGGELYMGNVVVSGSRELVDPAVAFEEEEATDDLMDLTAQVVTDLPPRMKLAMINHLKDQVDNLVQLTEAFEEYKVTIKTMKWPDDPADSRLLRASITPARHIIARRVGLNLSKYRQWSGTSEVPSSIQVHEASLSVKSKESKSMIQETVGNRLGGESKTCVGNAETLVGVLKRVERLRDPYRTAVYLHCAEGRTYSEIAGQLSLPEGTVKSHVSRGMKMLQLNMELQDEKCDQNGKSEQVVGVIGYIERLRDPYRTAIELHCLKEYTYPQIAKELGLPIGTVKSHVSRGMKILQGLAALS